MPGKISKVMSSKRVNKSNSSKEKLESFLSHPLLLIWLFLTVKVNLRVALSVSDTEITVLVEINSWHMEWVNPLEHNSQHRKYCLDIYLWAVSIKSLSIWAARASSGNGSEAEHWGHQSYSHKWSERKQSSGYTSFCKAKETHYSSWRLENCSSPLWFFFYL